MLQCLNNAITFFYLYGMLYGSGLQCGVRDVPWGAGINLYINIYWGA
jgi:hypothetical protein